jgi:hypothetical protein
VTGWTHNGKAFSLKPKEKPRYRNRRALEQVPCVRCFTPVRDPELVKLHVCDKHRAYAVTEG